jgi:hypothetical protein
MLCEPQSVLFVAASPLDFTLVHRVGAVWRQPEKPGLNRGRREATNSTDPDSIGYLRSSGSIREAGLLSSLHNTKEGIFRAHFRGWRGF